PYGQERPSATTNGTEKFATYLRDNETGLDYADQRYHSPGTGRFLTADPYRATSTGASDPTDPGSWNRYAYVGSDPVNRKDPTGMDWCWADDGYSGYGVSCLTSVPGVSVGSNPGDFGINIATQIATPLAAAVADSIADQLQSPDCTV